MLLQNQKEIADVAVIIDQFKKMEKIAVIALPDCFVHLYGTLTEFGY